MLGVIIGVASVIALISIGQGVKNFIDEQIEGLGTDLILVLPGQQTGPTGGVIGGSVSTLTIEDAKVVQRESDAIGRVAPVLEAGGLTTYEDNKYNTLINGTNSSYEAVRNHKVRLGRFISLKDEQKERSVVVLGTIVKDRLFGDEKPIGKLITINGDKFTVIGVMEPKGRALTINNDDRIFIPVTRAKELLDTTTVSMIFAQAVETGQINTAVNDTKRIIEREHGGKRDFSVSEQQDILKAFEGITDTLTGMLAGIAAVALIVGGIGIMNIMLVSVTERTREIGVRKAVGAKERDILYQFLVEAIVISILGGLIGVIVGLAGSRILTTFIPFLETLVTVESVLIALVFATLVGLFFGIYPAIRASKLDPIEALRNE